MTVMEAIRARTSIRAYEDLPVEEEKLQRVLEAGRQAPSAKNAQAWKFIVVRDKALRPQMQQACCDQPSVGSAPLTLVVCANEQRTMNCKQPARTVDCSIALSFMMLEAAAQGLGTCWLGAFDEEQVRAVLRIPEDYAIVAVTPLGYPAEAAREHIRKPMDQVVLYDGFPLK